MAFLLAFSDLVGCGEFVGPKRWVTCLVVGVFFGDFIGGSMILRTLLYMCEFSIVSHRRRSKLLLSLYNK